MGYDMAPSETHRMIKFYILRSLHDSDPFIIKGGCHCAAPLILLLYLIFVPVLDQDRLSHSEILWHLRYSKYKTDRVTLKENPHFYTSLPTLLKAHGDSIKIDPTEDFQQADTFYVLTDRQEPVHIMTGNKILHSFGNLWCYNNTIIFKGSAILFSSLCF